jgi:hypothetical protein
LDNEQFSENCILLTPKNDFFINNFCFPLFHDFNINLINEDDEKDDFEVKLKKYGKDYQIKNRTNLKNSNNILEQIKIYNSLKTFTIENFLCVNSILLYGTDEQKFRLLFHCWDHHKRGYLEITDFENIHDYYINCLVNMNLDLNTDQKTFYQKLFQKFLTDTEEKVIYKNNFVEKMKYYKNEIYGFGVYDTNNFVLSNCQKFGVNSHFGSLNWTISLNIMTGIKNSCESTLNLKRDIILEDFETELKTLLPINPQNEEKKHYFIDFAPRVFKKIRELSHISDDEYLYSLGIDQFLGNLLFGKLTTFSEQISEGKSGSYFYYSHDGKFMIKQ